MYKKIVNTCQLWGMIWDSFLNTQNVHVYTHVHRQLMAVYGEGVMNESSVRKWYWMFSGDRRNAHDKELSECWSLISEDLEQQMNRSVGIDAWLLTDRMRNSLKFLDPFLMKFFLFVCTLGTQKFVQGGCQIYCQTTTEKTAWALHWHFWRIITNTETSFLTILSQNLGFLLHHVSMNGTHLKAQCRHFGVSKTYHKSHFTVPGIINFLIHFKN